MEITLTDNSFELIFQHLVFDDILSLSQVSKSLNEIISSSPKCLEKMSLNLVKDDNNQVVEFLQCFRQNKRKYQNVKVDCHNSHYITEKYMLILKTIERSIVNLEVKNASFRWDEINTRNFHDQWLILTDLKQLKICNINDYTAEIFFISCTYLEQLHVENVRLSKYFNYCLRVNEKLKDLKILHPQGVSYDYEFYGFTAYNFKLDYLEFNCKENREKNKHEFLKRVIYPILTTQVRNLKRCRIKGAYFDAVNIVLETLNRDDFECKKLNYAVTSAHVQFTINDLQFFCMEMDEIHAEFCNNLMVFIERQNDSLKEICISSNSIDEKISCILFQNYPNVDHLSIGGSFEGQVNGRNEKITKIVTSSTSLEELETLLRLSPCLKVLQVFALSKDLLEFVNKELKDLEVIKFHFKDVDSYCSDIKLEHLTCYDPFLRICDDLHDLLFQHIEDESFAEELTRTWTRFYFK